MPREVRSRMISFSGYGMVLMLLNAVVWDRSDIVLLKALSSDIRQVSFFSVVFNISEKILLIPQTFAQAIGVSVMAQYGRDEKRLISMVSTAGRYVFLCAVPLLLGAAALSSPLIRLAYGSRYLPSIPIMAVVCVLAIPKSLLLPAQHLLQTTEHQKGLVIWGLICAAVNISLDLLLIPQHAAMGAAIANGTTQLVAMIGMWAFAMKLFPLDLQFSNLARILVSGGVMSAAVLLLLQYLHGPVALVCGVMAGAAVFVTMLRITGSLGSSDTERLRSLRHYVPGRARGLFRHAAAFSRTPQAGPGRPPGGEPMGIVFTVIFLSLAYISPMEIFPELAPYRPQIWFAILALLVGIPTMLRNPYNLRMPQVYLLIGMFGAVAFSRLANRFLGASVSAMTEFSAAALSFYFVLFNANSIRLLRVVAAAVIAIGVYLTIQGALAALPEPE